MHALTRTAGLRGASALALAASVVAVFPGAAAQAAVGPRFGENSLLPPLSAGRGRDAPGLAVNPADPNHIVEVEADPINLECNYNASFDGGRTWTGGRLTVRRGNEDPPFPSPACDQNFDSGGYMHVNTGGVAFGSGQNVYITFSVHRGGYNRPESNADAGAGDDTVVARSTDGGRTFEPAVLAVPGGGPVLPNNRGLAGLAMRPQIVAERRAGQPDRVYVAAWNCYIRVRASQTSRGGCSGGGGDRRLFVARSDNGGATWNAPVLASAANVRVGGDPSSPTRCTAGTPCAEAGSPDEQIVEPSQPVVGPDGAIYVAYKNRDITNGTTCPVNPLIAATAGGFPSSMAFCVVVTRSVDQGQTWQQFNTNQPVSNATLINPKLAIDPATPAGTGTLYVVYQRRVGTDPVDISFQSSADRGATWTPPVRVNDDPAGTSTANVVSMQTNPNVSAGPGGQINVIWGDRRHTYPGPGFYADVYAARSTDGGATFPNRRVTDRTINLDVGRSHDVGSELSPGFSWWGPTLAPLSDGSVLTAFMDSRLGNVDDGVQDIFLSRLNPAAGGPVSSAVRTATAPGLSVMLSRLAYPGGTEGVGDRGGEPFTRLVVANEGDVAGALAGAVLARARLGSLLVSPAGGLPAAVKAEAARMEPEGAYVIGDSAALSSAVASDLGETTRGGENVLRLAAPSNVTAANRPAELARRIAEQLAPLPGASPEAVIANPGTPEAASASALAAALKLPILFVDARTSLPPPTSAAISALGIKKALIVGGAGSVNPGVEAALITALGAANVKRLGGADQFETSETVLTEARLRGLPPNVVYVADGARSIDAAVLGAAVGRLTGLMLLTPAGSAATAEARLTALGIDAAVDRLVAAVGTGGTDPAPPATPPPPPTPGTPPPVVGGPTPPTIPIVPVRVRDIRAPLITLGGKSAQSVKPGCVSVTGQPDEAARLTATGTVARPALRASSRGRAQKAKTFRLRSTKANARARQRVTLRLCLTKTAITAVNQGLARGRRSTARVTIDAVDAAGNKRTVKRQIRIKD